MVVNHCPHGRENKWLALIKGKKKTPLAGSDDAASMIKGGCYLGARTRQPPTAQTINKKRLMWVRGVVCRSTRTQTLTVVACVILQGIPCFYECICMSDGVFIQFVCQLFNLMVSRLRSARGLSVSFL